MTTEFANRRWMIFPVSELYKIDWNQVLENQNVVIESAVLAGPVTFTNTITVTGTLVIV